jgi:hypothetical protein
MTVVLLPHWEDFAFPRRMSPRRARFRSIP